MKVIGLMALGQETLQILPRQCFAANLHARRRRVPLLNHFQWRRERMRQDFPLRIRGLLIVIHNHWPTHDLKPSLVPRHSIFDASEDSVALKLRPLHATRRENFVHGLITSECFLNTRFLIRQHF